MGNNAKRTSRAATPASIARESRQAYVSNTYTQRQTRSGLAGGAFCNHEAPNTWLSQKRSDNPLDRGAHARQKSFPHAKPNEWNTPLHRRRQNPRPHVNTPSLSAGGASYCKRTRSDPAASRAAAPEQTISNAGEAPPSTDGAAHRAIQPTKTICIIGGQEPHHGAAICAHKERLPKG